MKKVKFSPESVTLTLDLSFFPGLSLRKVARNINDHFNIELNYSTIYGWIRTYIPQISNYINSLLFATILYLISGMNTGSRVYSFVKDDEVFYGLFN